jgi:hAT family C-terminal dimerisation region
MNNIFDLLPTLAAPPVTKHTDELKFYLDSDPENVSDPLRWWVSKQNVYPYLSRMALDYLSIPGKSLYAAYFTICMTPTRVHDADPCA